MQGRRGRLLIGVLAAAVATPTSALAAQDGIVAEKSRNVSPATLKPVASVAKKKKKKKKKATPAATTTAAVPFAAGTSTTASASCGAATHLSGGGYAVSPPFTPPSSGIRSLNTISHPAGATTWTAGGAAFSTPAASGTFTTYARCERNSLGRVVGILSGSSILAPGTSQTFNLNCPPRTHVISGGYAGQGLAGFAYQGPNFRTLVLQSRRASPTTWLVQIVNSSFSPASATATAYAVCEQDAKGRSISEVFTFTPLVEDARATGNPTCTGKTHVISGGFALSPNGIGDIPSTGIDEFHPVGAKGWRVGLHEMLPPLALPAGSSMLSYAYCAPDAVPKKKKKKRKR
jgi:hypothetical protein